MPHWQNMFFCSDKWPDHSQGHLDVPPGGLRWRPLEHSFHIQSSRFEKIREMQASPRRVPIWLTQFLGTEWAFNKYALNVWNGSSPRLLQPVQSVVRQLKALSRPHTYLPILLREENTIAIVSRRWTTKANKWAWKCLPQLLGEANLRVRCISRVRGSKRSWPWA